MGPILSGVRVCDFTRYWAGPWCGTQLAAMGAEVIKIESRGWLDVHRRIGAMAENISGLNRCGGFDRRNPGKKSCTIDFSKPKGVELAKKIIRVSDVVTENFRPGTMAKLGLDYPVVREIRPDIIMASVSGWGQTGPYQGYVAVGQVVHAYAGLSNATGNVDGPPELPGIPFADPVHGIHAAFAVLSALWYRAKTGKGQYIDCSMLEVLSNFQPEGIMEYTMNQRQRPRMGNRDDAMAPHGCYRCRGEDKWVAIAVASNEEWETLCGVMGNPPWTTEARFKDPLSRWENQADLDRLMEEWTRQYAPETVMEMLQRAGVAAGPSYNTAELVRNPHLTERGFFQEIEHPEVGKRLVPVPPWEMSAVPRQAKRAPLFGEHNEYVFGELLGLSRSEIELLQQEQVIF